MFEKVVEIFEKNIDLGDKKITMETTLLQGLEINSLELVEIICAFEEAFDIVVNEREIRRFVKVQDIVEYLERVTSQ